VTVHRDCHVSFERALYSVPFALVGKAVAAGHRRVVTVYQDFRPVATHARARRPVSGAPSRIICRRMPSASSRTTALVSAAGRWIGAACAQLIGRLLGDRISRAPARRPGRHRAQAQYGAARLDAACQRAIAHDSPHYRTVKTILAGGHDLAPVSGDHPEPYAGRARFARAHAVAVRRRRHHVSLTRAQRRPFIQGATPMNPATELAPQLKQLRLSGILDSLDARNRQAIDAKLAYTEFLALLIQDEVARREQKKFGTRLRRAPSAPPRRSKASSSTACPRPTAPGP
jgi:hypothetical protein